MKKLFDLLKSKISGTKTRVRGMSLNHLESLLSLPYPNEGRYGENHGLCVLEVGNYVW
jgi:hypothetical protein